MHDPENRTSITIMLCCFTAPQKYVMPQSQVFTAPKIRVCFIQSNLALVFGELKSTKPRVKPSSTENLAEHLSYGSVKMHSTL